MQNTKMKIKIDEERGAFMPVRAHDTDAGLDLMTPGPFSIASGESLVINTGIHVELPPGTVGILKSKSGLSVKHGIHTVDGVIDEGYTGEIKVKLHNASRNIVVFDAGEKITQMVILPYVAPILEQVEKLDDTKRGDGGFGSTGS